MSERLYGATLLRRTAGVAMDRLQRPVRELHDVHDATIAFGQTHIERGSNPMVRLVGWLFGFPPAGRRMPTTITVLAARGKEIWHRRFRGHPILTQLEPTRAPGVIVERFRFGVTFELQVIQAAGALRFNVRGMRVCGVRMPSWLWPVLSAEERAERGGFAFDIDIALPGCGRLIRYRGWVQPH
jgi:hypothetical protein